MRIPFLYVVLVGATALAGCGSPPASGPAPVPAGAATVAEASAVTVPLPASAPVPLDSLEQQRVQLEHSQRDARLLPAGITRLDFAVDGDAAGLRFSLLPAEGARIDATVYQNNLGTAVAPVTDAAAWAQRTIPVTKGAQASLVLKSDKPFHLASCAVVPSAPQKPDVLVYLIDTVRQDHLSAYHYPLKTTPNIEDFARDATTFRNLTPMSSWTRPSVASLLTGTMDYTHHVFGAEDRLRAGLPSLAKALEQDGRQTCALITNPAVSSSFGIGASFQWEHDLWQLDFIPGWEEDQHAVDRALDFIADAHGQPFFLYLHVMAPHREYNAKEEYADLFMPDKFVGTASQVRIQKDLALYDAEIRYSDDQFARVIAALKDAGRYDNALIVLLSDHGEQFMEHGHMAHSHSLHREEVTVPCFIKLPRNWRVETPIRYTVQMADIAPTILDALGLKPAPGMEGRSLMPLIDQSGVFPPQPGFARLRFDDRHFYMAQTEYLKYIHDVILGESTWYNLQDDPDEQFPLRQPPDGGAELKAFADAIAAKPIPKPGETSAPLTPGESDNLKALGYL